ncbi:MAG: hypothetical protein JXJ19_08370 [Elusimicrobia bacterium]|nr:hypothetical protein [Elusimicrobiota bacterium]
MNIGLGRSIKRILIKTGRLNVLYLFLALTAGAMVIPRFFSDKITFSMGEFVYYKPLTHSICFDTSGVYDLAPAGNLFLPLRGYMYIGIIPSLIYFPVYKGWDSPYSVRLMGMMILLLQALILGRMFRVNASICFIFLICNMTYAFPHIVDTGSAGLQMLILYACCYLIYRHLYITGEKQKGEGYLFYIAALLFAGIWTKVSFVSLLPGILTVYLYGALRKGNYKLIVRKQYLLKAASAALIAAALTFVLLNSKTRGGGTYFDSIREVSAMMPAKIYYYIYEYMVNPYLCSHKIFSVGTGARWEGIALMLITLIFIVYAVKKCRAAGIPVDFAAAGISAYLITLAVIILPGKTVAIHNAVLPVSFLQLAVVYLYSKVKSGKITAVLFAAFILLNIHMYSGLKNFKNQQYTFPGIQRINEVLNKEFAEDYTIICLSWGIYDMKVMYGPPHQCVVSIAEIYDEKNLAEIIGNSKRKVLFIGRAGTDNEFIPDFIPGRTAYGFERIYKNRDMAEYNFPFDTGDLKLLYER